MVMMLMVVIMNDYDDNDDDAHIQSISEQFANLQFRIIVDKLSNWEYS